MLNNPGAVPNNSGAVLNNSGAVLNNPADGRLARLAGSAGAARLGGLARLARRLAGSCAEDMDAGHSACATPLVSPKCHPYGATPVQLHVCRGWDELMATQSS